ncbi:uncharacterized protein BDR25DRAFT_356331 [Lindgomyces ingoldianus]|uniref:Uncharacterized protein n=1 Tax=Lindgomyces ingoldianus TaxID=673940 RepID=A0ACB6QRH2_9PLEO|nr:uncharacterized protein BDR25DRAFT_356331 [Lindgomyces ingoldianus]KAF2469599.1 hypothetical protein BDR25DRAFT_356331 [Lindgomyces ingoldianus]
MNFRPLDKILEKSLPATYFSPVLTHVTETHWTPWWEQEMLLSRPHGSNPIAKQLVCKPAPLTKKNTQCSHSPLKFIEHAVHDYFSRLCTFSRDSSIGLFHLPFGRAYKFTPSKELMTHLHVQVTSWMDDQSEEDSQKQYLNCDPESEPLHLVPPIMPKIPNLRRMRLFEYFNLYLSAQQSSRMIHLQFSISRSGQVGLSPEERVSSTHFRTLVVLEIKPVLMLEEVSMMKDAELRIIVHKPEVVSKIIRLLDLKASEFFEIERGEGCSKLD